MKRGASARLVAFVLAVVVLAVDQLTKNWAVSDLIPGHTRPFIGQLLKLRLVRNPGAAFSLGTSFTGVLTLLAAVVLVLVLWRIWPRLQNTPWAVACGLFLGGVAGNLTDRLVRPPSFGLGEVIDFLVLPNWPVFNVADICLTSTAVLVVLLSVFYKTSYDGRSTQASSQAGEELQDA